MDEWDSIFAESEKSIGFSPNPFADVQEVHERGVRSLGPVVKELGVGRNVEDFARRALSESSLNMADNLAELAGFDVSDWRRKDQDYQEREPFASGVASTLGGLLTARAFPSSLLSAVAENAIAEAANERPESTAGGRALTSGLLTAATGGAVRGIGSAMAGRRANTPRATSFGAQMLGESGLGEQELAIARDLIQRSQSKPLTVVEALQAQGGPSQPIRENPLFTQTKMMVQSVPEAGNEASRFVAERSARAGERISTDLDSLYSPAALGEDFARSLEKAKAQGFEKYSEELTRLSDSAANIEFGDDYKKLFEKYPKLSEESYEKLSTLLGDKANTDLRSIAGRLAGDDKYKMSTQRWREIKSELQERLVKERKGNVGKLKGSERRAQKAVSAIIEALDESAVGHKELRESYAMLAAPSKLRAELQQVLSRTADQYDLPARLIGTPEKRLRLQDVMKDKYGDLLFNLGVEKRMHTGGSRLLGGSQTAPMLEAGKRIGQAEEAVARASEIASGYPPTQAKAISGLAKMFQARSLSDAQKTLFVRDMLATGEDGLRVLRNISKHLERVEKDKKTARLVAETAENLMRGIY